MCGIKIPQHDFALQMQGGGGGVFAGHYGMLHFELSFVKNISLKATLGCYNTITQ